MGVVEGGLVDLGEVVVEKLVLVMDVDVVVKVLGSGQITSPSNKLISVTSD